MAKTPTAVANPVSDCQLALGKNPDSGCNPCRRLTVTNSAGDCQLALTNCGRNMQPPAVFCFQKYPYHKTQTQPLTLIFAP